MIGGRDLIPVQVLIGVLTHELRLIEELRDALRQARGCGAAADADGADLAGRAVARKRLTLEEVQRHRAALMLSFTGTRTTSLDALDTYLNAPIPESLAELRAAIHRSMAGLARDLVARRRVSAHAREVEAVLLQQFLLGMAEPELELASALP